MMKVMAQRNKISALDDQKCRINSELAGLVFQWVC